MTSAYAPAAIAAFAGAVVMLAAQTPGPEADPHRLERAR